jgi:peptide/nickel transport system permease protein
LDSILTLNLPALSSSILHIIAPAFVLAFSGLAVVTRMTRATTLETLTQDYIKTAKAKGISNRRIITKHVMRNSMIPVATQIGLIFGGMLGGTFIIEAVFSWPGIGNYAAKSILELDFNVIMGVTIVYACIYVIVNLVVDILYAYLDPRIKLR